MQILIDESQIFVFPETKNKSCKISVVAGVILPYLPRNERRALGATCSKYDKASKLEDPEIITILDDLILRKIKVMLVCLDHDGMEQGEMEKYRDDTLQKLQSYASRNHLPIDIKIQDKLNMVVNKLLEHMQQLSLQEFAKMIAICECLTSCTEFFVNNANKFRAIDRRKISLIIDDQTPQVRDMLMDYFYFYAWIESKHDRFNPRSESLNEIKQFVIEEENGKRLDVTKIFKKTNIGNSGCREHCNLDDRYPQLKIADVCATVLQKVLNGTIVSEEIANKLKYVLEISAMFHFRENLYDRGNIPPSAQILFKD